MSINQHFCAFLRKKLNHKLLFLQTQERKDKQEKKRRTQRTKRTTTRKGMKDRKKEREGGSNKG